MPTTDLVNIYAEMNATGQGPLVEPEWINACAVIFYAGNFIIIIYIMIMIIIIIFYI